MNILTCLSKQLFGAKYERVVKSLITCLILFLAIRTAEIRMEIAPCILFLTATVLSMGLMWQTLNSSENTAGMTGLFMLPFSNREMIFSIVLAFVGYTLVTKTILVLTLFFAVYEWSVMQIATAFLCACNGCFMAAAWYTMCTAVARKKRFLTFVILWCGGTLLSVFVVQEIVLLALIVFVSLLFSTLVLMKSDAWLFYHPVSAKLLVRQVGGTGSILLYLLRYLITNKNYFMNTAGLCVIAGVLPFLLGEFEGVNTMPLGFAILCLNTPICILLSCDRDLEQAVRVLPGQAGRFCIRYCLFVFSVNMAVSSVYLISWCIRFGGVDITEIFTAFLIALQSAVLAVLLEWFYPIRNWKIENDLWHHPRKYIVPVIMLLIAGVIGMWPGMIWILPGIVLAECLGLMIAAK